MLAYSTCLNQHALRSIKLALIYYYPCDCCRNARWWRCAESSSYRILLPFHTTEASSFCNEFSRIDYYSKQSSYLWYDNTHPSQFSPLSVGQSYPSTIDSFGYLSDKRKQEQSRGESPTLTTTGLRRSGHVHGAWGVSQTDDSSSEKPALSPTSPVTHDFLTDLLQVCHLLLPKVFRCVLIRFRKPYLRDSADEVCRSPMLSGILILDN